MVSEMALIDKLLRVDGAEYAQVEILLSSDSCFSFMQCICQN